MHDLLIFLRAMGDGFAFLAVVGIIPVLAFLVWLVLPSRGR